MNKKIILLVLLTVMLFSTTIVFAENDITSAFIQEDLTINTVEEITEESIPEEGADSDTQTTLDGEIIQSVDSYLGGIMAPVGSLNNKIGGYTVLAIDTSGSMEGKPLEVAKESAIKFCQKLLEADKNNYVAVITINNESGFISDFTNDIDVLTSKISGLKKGGNTNISDALNDAKELLDRVTTTKTMRNIVILSDGLPQRGSDTKDGPYTSADNSDYKYANAAYNMASDIKGGTRIYTLGFFHSISGSEKAFGRRFLKDLQNCGYYEVDNTDDLGFVFEDLIEDVTEDGYIRNVIMTREWRKYNILTIDQTFTKNSDEKVALEVDVEWGISEPGKIHISQDSVNILSSEDGNMGTVAPGKIFKAGERIYVIAQDAKGNIVDKILLGMTILEPVFEGSFPGEHKINLFDGFSFTIPSDKPVLGNQKFEIDIGAVGMDLELDDEGKSFKAAVGIKFEKNDEGKFELEDFQTLKETVKEMKKDMKRGTKAFKRHLKKEDFWKKATKSRLKLKTDLEVDVTVSGYIEGKIVDGELVPVEGLIIVNASIEKVLSSGQVFVSVVPLCYSIKASGEVEVSAGIKDILPNEGFEPVFSGNFEVKPSCEISGGLGVLYVGQVGARGKAELPINIALDRYYQKVQLTGQAYFEIKALGFTLYDLELVKGTWTIYETGRESGLSLMTAPESVYDSIDVTVASPTEDRSYAQNPTIWHGMESVASLMGVDYINKQQRVLQTNTYPDAEPLVMSENGTKVMVWISDNTARTAVNKSMLVYSVYSKTDDKWSEPKPLMDNGAADYYPCVNDGYVVWQKATKVFENGVSTMEVAKNTDIYMAKFNGEGFDKPIRVTQNSVMDTQPRIASNDAEVTVVWTSNTKDDILGMTGTNSIHKRTYKNTKWSDEEVVKQNLNTIASVDVGYVNGEAMVAYNLDVDGDLDTINDREIFVVKGGTAKQITNDDVLDSRPVFEKIGTRDALMWYSNNNVYYMDDFDRKIINSISPEGYPGLTDEFSVSSDGKKTVVVWSSAPQNGVSEVNGVLYDGRLWSRDINITTTGQYVRNPHAAINKAGVLTIGFLRTQNVETEYYYENGRTDLCVIDVTPSYDINITNAYIVDEIEPGKEIPVYIDITNSGELAAKGMTLTLKDAKGRTYKKDYTDTILPGEKLELEMFYKIPDSVTKGDITVSAKLTEGEEYYTDNNAFTVPIGLSDIEITNISTEKSNGIYKVTVSLKNKGYATAEGVSLSLYEGSEEGKNISVYLWGNISSQSSVNPTFLIDENKVKFANGLAVYTVVVSAKNAEAALGNNEKTFVIEDKKPTYTVTYDYATNGGTSADAATKNVQADLYADLTVKAQKDLLQLGTDTTDPWEFVGWNTDPNATSALTSCKVTGDVTLYAIYKRDIDVYLYAGADFQNNSSAPQLQISQTLTIYNNEDGKYITLPKPVELNGWTPINWRKYTRIPVLGYETHEDFDYGTQYCVASDTKLYAVYNRTVYLSFNLGYGATSPQTLSATQYLYSVYGAQGTTVVSFELPEEPKRSGYVFGGWAIGSVNGKNIGTSGTIEIEESTVLYAVWAPVVSTKYTVTYNYSYNGGTSADKTSATVTSGAKADLGVKAQKSGWEFVGWNTDKDAKTALSSYTVTGNVTLYAVYKKVYSIRFNMANNAYSSTTVTIYNNTSSTSVNMPAVPTYSCWDVCGWRDDTSASAEKYKTSSLVIVSKDTEFYAVYNRSVSLSYNSDGASTTPQTQTALQYLNAGGSKSNVSFTLAPAVSKSGYTFSGWKTQNGNIYNPGDVIYPGESTVLYAVWTAVAPTNYTITYNYSYNGGTSADKTSATVTSGAKADLGVKAQKSGWEFVGWNTDKDAKTALSSYTVTGNVTLYAVYKKVYGIRFNMANNTYSSTTVTIYNNTSSASVNMPAVPTYSGWDVCGWRDDTSAGAEEYKTSSSVLVAKDTVFYAVYNRSVSLSYNSNGASTTPQTQTALQYLNAGGSKSNVSFTLAPAVSKSGYTFGGWAIGSQSGTVYNAGTVISVDQSTVAYAMWTAVAPAKYTVTYNYSYNGGTSADKTSATVTSGAKADLGVKAQKSGWEFVGWNTDKDAKTALSSYTVTDNVTLYAVYQKGISVKFMEERVSYSNVYTIYNNESSVSVTIRPLSEKTGWTVCGWRDDTLADKEEYIAYSKVSVTKDTIFYTIHSRNITLSYNTNGGGTTPPKQSALQYSNSGGGIGKGSFTLAPAVSKSGYVFDGWAVGSLSGTVYGAGEEILAEGDTVVYAVWSLAPLPKYTVTYNYSYNWGGSADKASDSVTVGDKADLSVKAQRADYEFVGWNTDKDAHTALSSCTVNGDVTLYAIFKRTFQVRFYSATNWDYVTATVYNKENSVPVNIPSPESYAGWSALGWCDDSFSVSPEYAEQTTVLLDGHKSFYALYSRNVTLSYDSNGGKNTPPDQTGVQYFNAGSQKQKVSFTLAADPYRYGYILWCWARNGDFKDLYTAGREILIDEDTTMKAVWEKFDMLCDINCTYTQSDAKHIFEVAVPGLTREATVIAALYDQNLNFMGAVTENFVIGGTTKLSIDKKENAYVAKIFVWNSGMKPLAHISLCDVSFPMGTK